MTCKVLKFPCYALGAEEYRGCEGPSRLQVGTRALVGSKAHHSILPSQNESEEDVCDVVTARGWRVHKGPLRIGLDCRSRRHGRGSR